MVCVALSACYQKIAQKSAGGADQYPGPENYGKKDLLVLKRSSGKEQRFEYKIRFGRNYCMLYKVKI